MSKCHRCGRERRPDIKTNFGTIVFTCDYCRLELLKDVEEAWSDAMKITGGQDMEDKLEIEVRSRLDEAGIRSGHMLYIACPYNHTNPAVRKFRLDISSAVAAYFAFVIGHRIFSPLSHSVEIDKWRPGHIPEHKWLALDETFMELCGAMVSMQIDGYESSVGLRHETRYFDEAMKPIVVLPANTCYAIYTHMMLLENLGHRG